MSRFIDFLLVRRSVVAAKLGPPGPSNSELQQILTAGIRVPDHKKLSPWRFIVFQGEAREQFGNVLASAYLSETVEPSAGRTETEQCRFLRAPLVIAAVSKHIDHPVVPEWEQILSAGAACQNILNAASALGYAAQWITEWYAYNEDIRTALGLKANERIAGFVYIGTATETPKERDRADLDDIVTYWKP